MTAPLIIGVVGYLFVGWCVAGRMYQFYECEPPTIKCSLGFYIIMGLLWFMSGPCFWFQGFNHKDRFKHWLFRPWIKKDK
jgi:hypothetical protein